MTGLIMVTKAAGCGGGGAGGGAGAGGGTTKKVTTTATTKQGCCDHDNNNNNQVSILAILVAALRKSMVSCRVERSTEEVMKRVRKMKMEMEMEMEMDIGWPTNVQHVAHVTFDRFHGFLGLPVEFQLEIPRKVPSASVSVFGVSAESMQCAYDAKGNSVPIILLLLQERLNSQGGLKAEGIFRINPENGQEERVRDQLNRGIVPDDIDVHCIAGLIKSWFRELPSGVLDGLSPEQVLQSNTEEDCISLVKQLKPMESALLNWAIDLMADVVENEEYNKMNARNIAMVFAPNMTQMSDPLTALMHAVQVMNLLKTLITKTLRDREEADITEDNYSPMSSRSSNPESDLEYDSQHEMATSCVSRGYEPVDYSHIRDYEHQADDGELIGIEECFLRQLDHNMVIGSNRKDKGDMLISGRKSWSYRSSGEGQLFSVRSLSERFDNVRDVEMDQLVETPSSLPMPLLVNS